jgi:hypothetical protein
MTRTQQGLPRQAEVVSLLNEAYDGWGTHPYFRWKYDLYPDYDAEKHTFYTRIDGELAAFRRAFCKQIVDTDQTNSIFILGDTAVGPAYRGQELYSDLHSKTIAFSEQQGAHRVSTFNRKTNVTFDANRDRGWRYRELPLKIRLLSPDVVLRQYTGLVLPEFSAIETVADRIGDRIHIGTSDGPVTLRDCVGSKSRTEPPSRSIGPSVSDRTLAQLIDLACSDDSVESLRTLLNGWANPLDGSSPSVERFEQSAEHAYQVHHNQSVSTAEFEAIVDLYDQQTTSFRRTPTDIRHILQYPDCDIVFITLDEECVGYAVIGPRSNGDILEGRVLELRVDHDEAFDVLIDEIERVSIDRGYDIILVFSDRPIGDLWASVDQQVIMWRDLDQSKSSPPLVDSCEISLYDVV